jgi:hypothetical protein
MNKHDKNIDSIRGLVKDIPSDYGLQKQATLDSVLSYASKKSTLDEAKNRIRDIERLPYRNRSWKRKHVYLLVHDLLNTTSLPGEIEDELYDVESGLIGNCAESYIFRYPDEEDVEKLAFFVRDYRWLTR